MNHLYTGLVTRAQSCDPSMIKRHDTVSFPQLASFSFIVFISAH